MGKKILDSKLLYVILSVIIAFGLWYYVAALEGDARSDTIYNIPVTFVGEDVLLENGLIITSETPSVNIRFSASATTWLSLNRDAITLTVDVAGVTQPGNHTLAYEISYSGISRNNVTVLDQTPTNISFEVERYTTRDIEIRGEFTGSLANNDDYTIPLENGQPKFEFTPEVITVSGRKSDVDQIAYARVTIGNENLTDTVRSDLPYQLIGANNEPLDLETLDIERSTELVSTVFQVRRIAEIPLTVTFEDGGGATLEKNVEWDMSLDSIRVSGESAAMESLVERGKLSVATIRLADLTNEVNTITCPIPLADELTILDGVTEVTITVNINGLTTKTLEVNEFTVQNKPEGYHATVRTRSLAVMVRGTEEELEQISAENLRVVADLAKINLASGQYTVDATIHFDGPGTAGVIGNDYPLVVQLTEE